MAQIFVEPKFKILALESGSERMSRVAGYEMPRPHAGLADFDRMRTDHMFPYRKRKKDRHGAFAHSGVHFLR